MFDIAIFISILWVCIASFVIVLCYNVFSDNERKQEKQKTYQTICCINRILNINVEWKLRNCYNL